MDPFPKMPDKLADIVSQLSLNDVASNNQTFRKKLLL